METTLEELYKTKKGRLSILYTIIRDDNLSIAEIVSQKEQAMNEKATEQNKLISGLALRATTMFGISPKEVLGNIEMVKPLVAKDILKSGVCKGTLFEETLLAQYP